MVIFMVINPLVMEYEWLIGALIVIWLEIFQGFHGILIIEEMIWWKSTNILIIYHLIGKINYFYGLIVIWYS